MTQAFTDEQKKISVEVGCALNHALEMARHLPKSGDNVSLINAIASASRFADRAGRATICAITVAQQADGGWSIVTGDGDENHTGETGLTASEVINRVTTGVMAACPPAAEPTPDCQQATDTEADCVTRCEGPDNSEWRRVRAMELAISANNGMHVSAIIESARKIETFLKDA
ncbi:hypothetical protein [Paracoccus sp. (in: a-proteobacteria)]|uniref:hypothetical protein n=1 Tax=Paracoccus sp. TaxID=267 RepID=UPI0028AABACA|nr:hypothetical protein [Paracoccus sp. (in: a-proteobacteria)]